MLSKPGSDCLPTTGYIRQAQLIPAILPFSSATLWRMVKTGGFPAPVKLSKRVTAWEVSAVKEWMRARTLTART
jgi:predicted DNA-binding transcriptional regulator AlpA